MLIVLSGVLNGELLFDDDILLEIGLLFDDGLSFEVWSRVDAVLRSGVLRRLSGICADVGVGEVLLVMDVGGRTSVVAGVFSARDCDSMMRE